VVAFPDMAARLGETATMDAILVALPIGACDVVAGSLVAFYAIGRFNTPRAVRSQTSRFQYFGSCATYTASCLGLLMLVTWVLRQKPEWLSLLHVGSSEEISSQLTSLDAPLVAALVLTTLLPSFPVLRDLDAKMLKFFHKMGAIPFGAYRWSQRMDAAQFTIAGNLLADAKTYIANSKLLPDALTDDLQPDFAVDSARYRFTRNLALYVALGNLSSWARFRSDFADDVAAFERKMSSFFAQSVGFFTLTGQLSAQQLEQAANSVEPFRSLTLEAYEDIRMMLARVLLYSANGEATVAQTLIRLGFAIESPAAIRLPMNLLSLDGVGIVVLFTASTALAATHMKPDKAIAIGLLVAVNQVIAAVFALLPKQVWRFADIRSAQERPILAYVISGLCALTVALPVAYGFYLLRPYVLSDSLPTITFAAQCKWLLSSTVLAVALAFLCDDYARAEREPAWLRWVEGAGLAGLMALTGTLVVNWLQPDQAAAHPDGQAPPLWVAVLLSASMGALFGATIPHWYRRTMRRAVAASVPAPLAPRGAAVLAAGGDRGPRAGLRV
jgi:hypothetical protein